MKKSLFNRIQYLIDISTKNSSVKAFADKIGAKQPTLSRNLNDQDDEKLTKYVEKILLVFPNIPVEWLIHGEGEAPKALYERSRMSAIENANGQCIGKLLCAALDFYGISKENVVKYTKISRETLDSVLNGILPPDFSFLEELYNKFEINPAYFMHGNEFLMREPRNQLDRVLFSIGEYKTPSHFLLQKLFGINKEEAKEYLKEYNEDKKNVARYGYSNHGVLDDEDENVLQSCVLKKEWLQYFIERTELNAAWFKTFYRPIAVATDEKIALFTQVDELRSENEQLRRELLLTQACLKQHCPNVFSEEAINQ